MSRTNGKEKRWGRRRGWGGRVRKKREGERVGEVGRGWRRKGGGRGGVERRSREERSGVEKRLVQFGSDTITLET